MKKHIVKETSLKVRLANQRSHRRFLWMLRLRTCLRRAIESGTLLVLAAGGFTLTLGAARWSPGLAAAGATLLGAWLAYTVLRAKLEDDANLAVSWLAPSSATLRSWRIDVELHAARTASYPQNARTIRGVSADHLRSALGRAGLLRIEWEGRWIVRVSFERELGERISDFEYEVELCRRAWEKHMGWDPLLECP